MVLVGEGVLGENGRVWDRNGLYFRIREGWLVGRRAWQVYSHEQKDRGALDFLGAAEMHVMLSGKGYFKRRNMSVNKDKRCISLTRTGSFRGRCRLFLTLGVCAGLMTVAHHRTREDANCTNCMRGFVRFRCRQQKRQKQLKWRGSIPFVSQGTSTTTPPPHHGRSKGRIPWTLFSPDRLMRMSLTPIAGCSQQVGSREVCVFICPTL